MKALILGLLVFVPAALTYAVGYTAGKKKDSPRLRLAERRELVAQRDLIDRLTQQAAQHVALGDTFAPIVLDEVFTTRRKLEQ